MVALPRTMTSTRALPVGVALREMLSALVDATGYVLLTSHRDVVESWFSDNMERCFAESRDGMLVLWRMDGTQMVRCEAVRS